MPILDAAWEGLQLVFSWPNILYPFIGTLLAMLVSAMPGISGVTLMALAIPVTMSWGMLPVMLLFGALVGGATFMGSITAILLNIPGKNSAAATMLDGYPLAQQGRAREAIGCAATASALGSTFGIMILVALIPVMRPAILLIGPAEFLMLVIWGLTTIAATTGGSVVKALAAAGIGFLISFSGFDPRTAELRYTFGSLYLRDGFDLVPVFLGLFALAQTIELAQSNRRTISGKMRPEELSGSLWEGVLAVFRNFGLFVRSSLIGTVVGMMPGVGGTVASFVAYGHARQTAREDADRFGKGDIRGVLAPEAAVDAKDGGALVPTLAFGVPGGTGTAMLLAVLVIHGLVPGRELLTTQLTLVFVLIWSLFLSNLLTSLVGVATLGLMIRVTMIRTRRIVPLMLVLVTFGAFAYRGQVEDVFTAFLFGIVGYYMKKHEWPRISLVIALVLGPLLERYLHVTVQLEEAGRIDFWSRPITLGLAALTILGLAFHWSRPNRSPVARAPQAPEQVLIALGLFACVGALLVNTLELGPVARRVPLVVSVITLALLGVEVLRTLGFPRAGLAMFRGRTRQSIAARGRSRGRGSTVGRELRIFGYFLAVPALATLTGVGVAAPVYVLCDLKVRAGETWRFALAVAGVTALACYVLFRFLIPLPIYDPWVGAWLRHL